MTYNNDASEALHVPTNIDTIMKWSVTCSGYLEWARKRSSISFLWVNYWNPDIRFFSWTCEISDYQWATTREKILSHSFNRCWTFLTSWPECGTRTTLNVNSDRWVWLQCLFIPRVNGLTFYALFVITHISSTSFLPISTLWLLTHSAQRPSHMAVDEEGIWPNSSHVRYS